MPQIKTCQPALARFERCSSINIIDVNRTDMAQLLLVVKSWKAEESSGYWKTKQPNKLKLCFSEVSATKTWP